MSARARRAEPEDPLEIPAFLRYPKDYMPPPTNGRLLSNIELVQREERSANSGKKVVDLDEQARLLAEQEAEERRLQKARARIDRMKRKMGGPGPRLVATASGFVPAEVEERRYQARLRRAHEDYVRTFGGKVPSDLPKVAAVSKPEPRPARPTPKRAAPVLPETLLTNRAAAKAAGHRFYQGEDCGPRHGGKRYVSTNGCPACEKQARQERLAAIAAIPE